MPDPTKTRTLAAQRRALGQWLQERQLQHALRDTPESHVAHGHWIAEQPAPQPGDIRLLPPAPLAYCAWERPVYIAVLDALDAGFEVAPFGPLSQPATPQEWFTGLPFLPLRVLCLWNRRHLEANMLAGTWRTATLPAHKRLQALRICREASPQSAAAGIHPARLGPPLQHPLDPRWPYIHEESMLFDEMLQALKQAHQPDSGCYPIPASDTAPLLKAAEKKETPPGSY